MTRSHGRHASLAATSVGSVTARSEKFKRGRTRSTLRNFLGRLGRSNSQDLSQRKNTTTTDKTFIAKTPVRYVLYFLFKIKKKIYFYDKIRILVLLQIQEFLLFQKTHRWLHHY